ncbi:MAG: hypothetical protein U0792_10030 [Gemmataceae bacterium]
MDKEKDEYVLLHIAAALSQGIGQQRNELTALVAKLSAKSDTHLAQMVWYRISERLARDSSGAIKLMHQTGSPLIRRNVVRFLLSGPEDKMNDEIVKLVELLDAASRSPEMASSGLIPDTVAAMRESIVGRRNVKLPNTWARQREQTPIEKLTEEVWKVMPSRLSPSLFFFFFFFLAWRVRRSRSISLGREFNRRTPRPLNESLRLNCSAH